MVECPWVQSPVTTTTTTTTKINKIRKRKEKEKKSKQIRKMIVTISFAKNSILPIFL